MKIVLWQFFSAVKSMIQINQSTTSKLFQFIAKST